MMDGGMDAKTEGVQPQHRISARMCLCWFVFLDYMEL